MRRFENKTVLITGAGRGIGRGIALCLATEGADIVVNDRTLSDEAQSVAGEITALGRQVLLWPADVAVNGLGRCIGSQVKMSQGRGDAVDPPSGTVSLMNPREASPTRICHPHG